MTQANCSIVITKLKTGGYQASASQWPDCTAVAETEEAARAAVEEAIAHLTASRTKEVKKKK